MPTFHLSPLTSHLSPRPSAWLHNPALSLWLSVDPLSDKYPGVSPYVYCGNNPVKIIDPDGCDWVEREYEGRSEVYYDRSVKSQADIDKKYGEESGIRYLADGTKVGNGQYTVYNDHKNNKNGVMKDANGNVVNPNRSIIYGKDYTLFAGVTDESVNAATLHKNYFGSSYIGPKNPKSYGGAKDNYDYLPEWSPTEMATYHHDQDYDARGAQGISGALSKRTKCADLCLINECKVIARNPNVSSKERSIARKIAFGFTAIDFLFKTPFH